MKTETPDNPALPAPRALLLGMILPLSLGVVRAPAAEAEFTDGLLKNVTITLTYPGGIVEKAGSETRYYVEARDYQRSEIKLKAEKAQGWEWDLPNRGQTPTVADIPAEALNLKDKEGEDDVFVMRAMASKDSQSATVSVSIRVIGLKHETRAEYPNYRGLDRKRLKLGLYELVEMEMICPSSWQIRWEPVPQAGKLKLIDAAYPTKRLYEAPETKADADAVTAHVFSPVGKDYTVKFKTIAPEKIFTEYRTPVDSPKNSDHLGGMMDIYFLPDDVNFGRLFTWEGNAAFKIAGAGSHYDYYAGKKHSDYPSRIDQPGEAAMGTREGKGTLMAEDRCKLGNWFDFTGPNDPNLKALPGWAELPIPFSYNTKKQVAGGVELGKLTAKIIAEVPADAKDKSSATKTMTKGSPATTGPKPIF